MTAEELISKMTDYIADRSTDVAECKEDPEMYIAGVNEIKAMQKLLIAMEREVYDSEVQ